VTKIFVFDQLRRLVLVVARRLGKERFETIARLRIFFFLERDLGEIVLRLAEVGIIRKRFPESGLRFIEFAFLHQNFAAQIIGRGVVRHSRCGEVEQLGRALKSRC
jgi:hypothetical protein